MKRIPSTIGGREVQTGAMPASPTREARARRQLVLALRCGLAGLSLFLCVAAARAENPPKPVVVPFVQLPSGHLTVQVKIDGKGPYQLIFDTGAPVTVLNNRIAKDSGLTKDLKKPFFTPFGALGEAKIKKLEVGDQTAENVTAMIMDHPTVTLFNDFYEKKYGKIDGIVGFPFFARFKTTIDYEKKTLTFVPNGFKPPDVMKTMENLIMEVALQAGNPPPKVLSAAGVWGLTPASKDDKDDDAGVTIKDVLSGGPAEKAGLKAGDRLLTLDGRWTDSIADLFAAAGRVKPGTAVKVTLKRGDKELSVEVKPTAGL
jgi:hypothetical protein